MSCWKILHPSNTEDECEVGLTCKDEAEGLGPTPGVSRCHFGGPPAPEVQPEPVPAQPQAADDEVVVKKRALKGVKQQVSALLHGEDLPEGAQARKLAKVPYEVLAVPRGETTCPMCRQVFKTHHHIMVHMGVHRGEKFPCGKCGKVLVNRRYLAEHTQVCVQGNKVSCPVCNKQYSSVSVMHKHHWAKHGADLVVPQGGFICPFCGKSFQVKKTWREHKPYYADKPDDKGPYYCRVAGCLMAGHAFTHFFVMNLNLHMSNIHGWKERHT